MTLRALLPFLLALGACDPKDDDTGLDAPEVTSLEVTVSPHIVTVATVRWTTSEPVQGYLEFGPAGDLHLSTALEMEPRTDHEAVLLGLPGATDAEVRPVLVLEDGSEHRGAAVPYTTGSLPVALPTITVEGGDAGAWLPVPILGVLTAPVILDPQGRIVWYWLDESGLDVYRVRLSRDGGSVLYNAASVSGDPADDSRLVRVSLDGAEVEEIPVPLLAHDFVELPDGTLGAIQVEYRDVEGTEVRGDGLVEVTPDGTVTPVWSAWDCFDPATDPGDAPEHGWTFANALDYDEAADDWLLGMRNQSAITRIDRATGTCAWVLGGTAATMEFTAGSDIFMHQHQFDLADGRLLVFDNEGAAGSCSRVVEYALDEVAGTADQFGAYQTDPCIYTFVLGDVARLPGGDLLVDWATGGRIERVGSGGTPTWAASTALGYAFGFMSPETGLLR